MTANGSVASRLWSVADQLRANSNLDSSEYSFPVLGLIFLAYASDKFKAARAELERENQTGRRRIGAADYQAQGVLYVPSIAQFDTLLGLTEGENVGAALNEAMKAIEETNSGLRGMLPKDYSRIENGTLIELLRLLSSVHSDLEGDVFGQIYEYFLGNFAIAEGRRAGQFYTPTSVVRLIVEVLEPLSGRIFDPACGSGGMFVQSARFVENQRGNANDDISIYGQENLARNARICRMNLAIHGLSGDILEGNTYYEDRHSSTGRFDYVMANPPFNVDYVDYERLEGDNRLPFATSTGQYANYVWIQIFYSALTDQGRAGFVMANSASDSRGADLEIRRKLLEADAVGTMIGIGPKFFINVQLPCTLWFLDKGKAGTDREGKVLFIDARQMYREVSRALRDFTPAQLEFLANIARLYRGEQPETVDGSDDLMAEHFPGGEYVDVPGLCNVATIEEIEAQGWSLNPGRYVGIAPRPAEEFEFAERLEELNEELEILNAEARELEEQISENIN